MTARGLGALRSGIDPSLDELAGLFLRTGCRLPSRPRIPGPRDKVILGNMLVKQREVAAAVQLHVLDLTADVAERLAFPRHLPGSQPPARMAGNAFVARAFMQR